MQVCPTANGPAAGVKNKSIFSSNIIEVHNLDEVLNPPHVILFFFGDLQDAITEILFDGIGRFYVIFKANNDAEEATQRDEERYGVSRRKISIKLIHKEDMIDA